MEGEVEKAEVAAAVDFLLVQAFSPPSVGYDVGCVCLRREFAFFVLVISTNVYSPDSIDRSSSQCVVAMLWVWYVALVTKTCEVHKLITATAIGIHASAIRRQGHAS